MSFVLPVISSKFYTLRGRAAIDLQPELQHNFHLFALLPIDPFFSLQLRLFECLTGLFLASQT